MQGHLFSTLLFKDLLIRLMDFVDYYKILGIDKSATSKEIKMPLSEIGQKVSSGFESQ